MRIQRILFILLSFSLILLLMTGCEKTVTEYVEQSWTEVGDFYQGNKIILNSHVTENNDFFVASMFTLFNAGNEQEQFAKIHDYSRHYLSMNHKPAISDEIMAYRTEYRYSFILRRNDTRDSSEVYPNSFSGKYIPINPIDTTQTTDLEFMTESWYKPLAAINDNNQVLTLLTDRGDWNNYFCLINYELQDYDDDNPGDYTGIDVIDKKLINSGCYGYIHLATLYGYEDRFFFSSPQEGNYIIYSNGDFRKYDHSVFRFYNSQYFEYQDQLYAQMSDGRVYASQDFGETWDLINSVNICPNYYIIDNKIIGKINYQLFHIDFEVEEILEIDSDGLSEKAITSINEHNGKVYISTLSGLYYRNLDDFFTYKETDSALNQDGERLQFVSKTAD